MASKREGELRVEAVASQLAALIKVIKLYFQRRVIEQVEPDSGRRPVIGSLQKVHGIVQTVMRVLVAEVWLVDSELPGKLRIRHRTPDGPGCSVYMIALEY